MLFQSINKIKRSSILTSLALIALGVVMVICPGSYTMSLISGMGYAAMILAVVMGLEYLDSKKAFMNGVLLFCAFVIGLLGLAIVVFKDSVLQILGWTFGILLILQGIELFYNAVMYVRPAGRKGWWFLAFLAVLLIAAGVMILLNRWWDTPEMLLKVIGLALLFDAVIGIIRLIFIWPIKGDEGGME